MKVKDFIKRFTIDPSVDIEPHFLKVKELDIDAIHHEGCFNCEDKANQMRLKSDSWSGVQYCWKCDSLNVIYYSDRMGGTYTDTVRCYQAPQPPEERE